VLARHRQRLAAGGEHADAGRDPQHVGQQPGDRREEVLAVVHHQQQPLVPQVRQQQGRRLGRGLVAQVQCGEDGVTDQRRVAHVRELDQPHPVPERPGEIGPGSDRQAGLAHATRPEERDQARVGEPRPYVGELPAAADEGGRLGRQVAWAAHGSGHAAGHGTSPARAAGRPRPPADHEFP
jgi:hypothetical protein